MTKIIEMRQMRPTDLHFVLSSWLRSARRDAADMSNSDYYRAYDLLAKELISRSEVLMAVDPQDESFLLGFIVYRKIENDLVIHYAYVRAAFRKLGVLKAMLAHIFPEREPGQAIFATHKPTLRQEIFDKLNIIYAPQLKTRLK